MVYTEEDKIKAVKEYDENFALIEASVGKSEQHVYLRREKILNSKCTTIKKNMGILAQVGCPLGTKDCLLCPGYYIKVKKNGTKARHIACNKNDEGAMKVNCGIWDVINRETDWNKVANKIKKRYEQRKKEDKKYEEENTSKKKSKKISKKSNKVKYAESHF